MLDVLTIAAQRKATSTNKIGKPVPVILVKSG